MKRSPTIDTRGFLLFGVLAALAAVPSSALGLSLDPNTGVVPRVFSPNGDGINDVVFFTVNNPQQAFLSGVVSNMTGAQIGTLTPAPTADTLYWNGRDEAGNVVPAGAYVYRIDGDGAPVTGVVVVVR